MIVAHAGNGSKGEMMEGKKREWESVVATILRATKFLKICFRSASFTAPISVNACWLVLL